MQSMQTALLSPRRHLRTPEQTPGPMPARLTIVMHGAIPPGPQQSAHELPPAETREQQTPVARGTRIQRP